MKRRREAELLRSQQSVFYYSDMEGLEDSKLRARPDYFREMYPHMLIEDVANGIMPIGGRSEKRPFRGFVTPPSQKVEDLIASAVSRRGHDSDFAGTLCDFFHDCAQTIMAYTEAVYEIVYLSRPSDQTLVGFELVFIQPHTIRRKFGKLIQYLPADVAKKRNLPRHIRLSPERIVTFKPPAYMDQKIDVVMETLSLVSKRITPDFAFTEVPGHPRSVPYDFKTHNITREQLIANTTKIIGWNARSLFREEVLEYYLLHRELLFERFKIELRNSILTTLNDALAIAGQVVGFSGRVEVEGLPTLEEIQDAQVQLSEGDQPFKEIFERFSIY